MNYYAYKITRDYGFAPNPFYGYCTLACCKPNIRKKAQVGDWIIGTGSKQIHLLYHLIYIMQVTMVLSFEEYWDDETFKLKKPNVNGSLIQIRGDNIYYKENNEWRQLDSHHSLPNGEVNQSNLDTDISGKNVLVSDHFIYLGDTRFKVPEKYKSLCPDKTQRNYITIKNKTLAVEFINHIKTQFSLGIHGDPIHWRDYMQLSLF